MISRTPSEHGLFDPLEEDLDWGWLWNEFINQRMSIL
jgi:hypothetical protein